ncbi:hypothetical protein Nepgr_012313 [Nepenthes gracilis]|uniref:Uncharacterized protein n=1 Tax=Nepenthes gracilis TaxID=150966 RepID=A0AAD3SH41_NEPGR|nr:hypothetical protein Nepgr_012313 [Nepenthes gracilis]
MVDRSTDPWGGLVLRHMVGVSSVAVQSTLPRASASSQLVMLRSAAAPNQSTVLLGASTSSHFMVLLVTSAPTWGQGWIWQPPHDNQFQMCFFVNIVTLPLSSDTLFRIDAATVANLSQATTLPRDAMQLANLSIQWLVH